MRERRIDEDVVDAPIALRCLVSIGVAQIDEPGFGACLWALIGRDLIEVAYERHACAEAGLDMVEYLARAANRSWNQDVGVMVHDPQARILVRIVRIFDLQSDVECSSMLVC